jgi:pimeloyl-ACP methyl ester carboxylesterase
MARRVTALVVVLVAVFAAGVASASAASWRPCGSSSGARCTRVVVPLDRSGVLPGTISLRVARLRADPGPTVPPVLVYLSGGPGSGGLAELEGLLWSLPPVVRSFRVVTYDQRGTGASGLLRCRAMERDARVRSTAAAAACARRLGAARRHYTTADSVADLEAVRVALGAPEMMLLGVSYGTKLALDYARAHPDRVSRLALDSVADPDDRDPFGLAGFRAMGPTLAALCPAACRGVSADPAADLAQLVRRLRRAPLRGLGPVRIADLLYDADYLPPLRAAVPAGVRAALAGDGAPLRRLATVGDQLGEWLPPPRVFSNARYATVCEETPLPWDPATPFASRMGQARARAAVLGPAAFRPFDFATAAADEIELCLHWPSVPAPYPPPGAGDGSPYPDVPVLLLQGGEDLRTPPEVSAAVAARFPRAERVVVPGVGHAAVPSDPSGCAARALARFLVGRPAGGDCERIPTGVPAVTVPPRRLAGVAPLATLRSAARLPLRVRRTAAAIGLTLDDVRFALSPAFLVQAGPGLRGGSYRWQRDGVVLQGYEAVGGVRLTGRVHGRRLVLRVLGRAAAPGTVSVAPGGRLEGTLGGRRVWGRLPHRPPQPGAEGAVSRAARATFARIP